MSSTNSPTEGQNTSPKMHKLTRLVEMSSQLNSMLPLDELLSNIMDLAAEITDSEGASVLLWDNNNRELYFAATTTDSTVDLIGKPVPLEGSIAGTILVERSVVRVQNARQDPRHYNKIEEEDGFVTHSLMGVPMTVKNERIGVLEVVNKRQLPWTDDDEQYLSALASQAAVAIEGAQLVAALKKANDELSELDKLKNDFIALASHELRTPLGVVLGYASFLQEETSNNPEAHEHADKVMNSALKLRRIIENLTNLRYLEQNATHLQFESVGVHQLLEDVRFDMKTLLDASGRALDIQPVDERVLVNVDRARIAMALTNIVRNALEFTIEDEAVTIETENRAGEVWIRVIDEGIGIEQNQLERIFEKFYQVESHLIRHHEGLGIGLSISRALVEAHSGRVWAESAGLGEGSTFIVSLPLEETAG